MADVTGFDLTAKVVHTADGEHVPFDTLVLAAGSTHHYFGKDKEWEPATGLKTVEDATEIRRNLLSAFERAERTTDPAERARALTFVVVGGGPTGWRWPAASPSWRGKRSAATSAPSTPAPPASSWWRTATG